MGWILLLGGIVIIALTAPKAVKQYQNNDVDGNFQLLHGLETMPEEKTVQEQPALDQEFLFERLELFTQKLNLLQYKFDQWDETLKQLDLPQGATFKEVMNDANQLTLFDDIYLDYNQGKSITDIARQYKRGKGEIELILSLRK